MDAAEAEPAAGQPTAGAQFECPDVPIEYVPVRVNTTYEEEVNQADLWLVTEVIKTAVGLSRKHRVLLDGEDAAAYAAETVKWTIAADHASHTYQLRFLYPPHVFASYALVSRIVGLRPESIDVEETGTTFDVNEGRMTLAITVLMHPYVHVTRAQTYFFDVPPRYYVVNGNSRPLGQHDEGVKQSRKRPADAVSSSSSSSNGNDQDTRPSKMARFTQR